MFHKSQDDTPFFFTFGHTTIYAVDSEERVSFHCDHVDVVGDDSRLLLQGRGNFTNINDCIFETVTDVYSPGIQVKLDHHASPITTAFDAPDVGIELFPSQYEPTFNIKKMEPAE